MLYIGRFESWEWAIGYIPENRQYSFTKSAEPTRLSPNSRAQSLELKELIQYGVRSVLLFYNRFGPNPENDRLQPCDLLVHLDKALSDVGVPAAPPSASCSRLISADSHRFINFRLVSSDFPSHPIDTILFFSCLHPLVWIPICSFAFLIPQLMRINSWTWMSRQVFTPEPPWLSQNTFWLRLHLSLCHPGNQQLLEGGASGINAVRSPKAITTRGLSQRPTFHASPGCSKQKELGLRGCITCLPCPLISCAVWQTGVTSRRWGRPLSYLPLLHAWPPPIPASSWAPHHAWWIDPLTLPRTLEVVPWLNLL